MRRPRGWSPSPAALSCCNVGIYVAYPALVGRQTGMAGDGGRSGHQRRGGGFLWPLMLRRLTLLASTAIKFVIWWTYPLTTNRAAFPQAHHPAPSAGHPQLPPITARPQRSRSQGWPQATPQGNGLDPARTLPPSQIGDTHVRNDLQPTTRKCNDVPRHLSTVSRDITTAHPEVFCFMT